jgi:MFS family permease
MIRTVASPRHRPVRAGPPATRYPSRMARPVLAVILGTFTLRLSTGLTGGALVYYLAVLEDYGGPKVDAITLGWFVALFYAAELIGSPFFGVLSDRLGHRRVMLFGPAFGAVAVIVTAISTSIPVLLGTRVLEGASTAASVPSILGFIAFATASDEALRGRATARFEAATLAGLLGGLVIAGPLFTLLGPGVFLLNAVLYGISFAIYKLGVPVHAEPPPHPDQGIRGAAALKRYWGILTGSHVWLLAPTWIAINATLGLFTTQTLFQLVSKPSPGFENQLLMGGVDRNLVSVVLGLGGILFFVGIFWWGRRFARMRRTTIIFYGILGGGAVLLAGFGVNHAAGLPIAVPLGLAALAIGGLFVLAGATPAAIGLLADVTEAYPDDRGAIMGLYSVFLALGQITGSLLGGASAEQWGLDGIFLVALGLLAVALLPLSHLRRFEHFVGPGAAETFGPA